MKTHLLQKQGRPLIFILARNLDTQRRLDTSWNSWAINYKPFRFHRSQISIEVKNVTSSYCPTDPLYQIWAKNTSGQEVTWIFIFSVVLICQDNKQERCHCAEFKFAICFTQQQKVNCRWKMPPKHVNLVKHMQNENLMHGRMLDTTDEYSIYCESLAID